MEAAQRIAERIRQGDIPQRQKSYYPGRPFREPVLREVRNAGGELAGVITRSSYGCQVLNTARVMFVHVDLPERRPSGGLLKRLFGKPELKPPEGNQNNVIAKAEMWTRRNPDWGWRIYRTRAGLRLLATHAVFDPEAAISDGVFDALGADPLYRPLCKAQKCFRARLTPKPWRCGIHDKPERWPWLADKAEKRFQLGRRSITAQPLIGPPAGWSKPPAAGTSIRTPSSSWQFTTRQHGRDRKPLLRK